MNSVELGDQVRALLAQNQKVEAVKRVHKTTGWGLKKSKDYVDALADATPPAPRAMEQEVDYSSLPADELLTALEQAGRTPNLDLIRACLERR